ncbi:hypothetical protein ACMFMG_001767 [Clarireedia jacksonii]
MGIPHLITYLRPFATRESLKDKEIVIDGPGMAYHIYHVCQRTRVSAGNYFEAAPSYKELGETVLAWLHGLEEEGCTVKRIYFDGYLPASKFDVRLERLGGNTKQLHDYYNQYPDGVRYQLNSTIRQKLSSFPFGFAYQRNSYTKLPALPFLVAACIEALQGSNAYKDIVEMVPGEADAFCASYLSTHGGIVLTGDSDLLVHDLGANGSVTFFKDIEVAFENGKSTLLSQIYHAAFIAERLDLPQTDGIRALAFEIVIDSHRKFRKLLTQAKTSDAIRLHKPAYEAFIKEYLPMKINVSDHTSVAKDSSALRMAFQYLDTRICEYILQFPYLMNELGVGQDIPKSKETTDIFLPFLIDCPAKTNAWEMSTPIRQLAYGCINLIVPVVDHKSSIFEHRRQPKTSHGREWQIPLPSDIPEACGNIIAFLEHVQHDLLNHPSINFWSAVAFTQDVDMSLTLGKAGLSKRLLSSGSSRRKNQMTWDRIHWTAQVHGSYYSFRVLKQVIEFVVAVGDRATLPETLLRLHQLLHSLPSLLVSQVDDVGDIERLQALAAKASSDEMIKKSEQSESSSAKQKASSKRSQKKKRRKRKREQASVDEEDGVSSNNPFNLLALA